MAMSDLTKDEIRVVKYLLITAKMRAEDATDKATIEKIIDKMNS